MQIQLTHSLFSSLLRSQLEIRDEVISFQAYFSSPDIGSAVLHGGGGGGSSEFCWMMEG